MVVTGIRRHPQASAGTHAACRRADSRESHRRITNFPIFGVVSPPAPPAANSDRAIHVLLLSVVGTAWCVPDPQRELPTRASVAARAAVRHRGMRVGIRACAGSGRRTVAPDTTLPPHELVVVAEMHACTRRHLVATTCVLVLLSIWKGGAGRRTGAAGRGAGNPNGVPSRRCGRARNPSAGASRTGTGRAPDLNLTPVRTGTCASDLGVIRGDVGGVVRGDLGGDVRGLVGGDVRGLVRGDLGDDVRMIPRTRAVFAFGGGADESRQPGAGARGTRPLREWTTQRRRLLGCAEQAEEAREKRITFPIFT